MSVQMRRNQIAKNKKMRRMRKNLWRKKLIQMIVMMRQQVVVVGKKSRCNLRKANEEFLTLMTMRMARMEQAKRKSSHVERMIVVSMNWSS